MELQGKKALIMVDNLFNDYELWYPYFRLQEAGAEVSLVGQESDQIYKGKDGTQAKSDKAIKSIKAEDYQALVIPGGYAPDHMRRNPDMVNLVRTMHEQGKPIAAICHAGWMLASAKILKGKTVTSFFAIRDDLEHAGANWVDKDVVQDGNLITSRKPDDLPVFMRTLINTLA